MATNTTVKAEKAPNYTAEAVARITGAYTANPSRETVAALAAELGKTARQITMKLVSLKIYQKEAPEKGKTKNGEKVEHKNDTATFIGAVLRLSEPDTESLTKCNKAALQAIAKALAESKPIED